VKNKLISSLVLPLGKTLNRMPLPFERLDKFSSNRWQLRCSSVKSRASNRKLQILGSTPGAVASCCYLWETFNATFCILRSWWPSLTKHRKQNRSVLEWF